MELEDAAEMGGVIEAPLARDLGDAAAAEGRIGKRVAAAFETPPSDPGGGALPGLLEEAVEIAYGNAVGLGDALEIEVPLMQMVEDVILDVLEVLLRQAGG
jgi:hypothetical protein